MIRVRRYRVFLAFVVFFIAGIWFFNASGSWDAGTSSFGTRPFGSSFGSPPPGSSPSLPLTEGQTPEEKADKIVHENARPPAPPASKKTSTTSSAHDAAATSTDDNNDTSTTGAKHKAVDESKDSATGGGKTLKPSKPYRPLDEPIDGFEHTGIAMSDGKGKGRLEGGATFNPQNAIHWSKQPEHFPVPSGSTIQLPTGTAKAIPRIQHKFLRETTTERTQREAKRDVIRATFERSWAGYREHAWMHDELSPVRGGFKDPFGGWAASLVDALDTLWIMELVEAFDEAVDAVASIDFTTLNRADIPMFETTIRYLGGLLGAYDVSGRQLKYQVLLDKAVELADVLMGAFDTPNRMPLVYYQWHPKMAANPHRAGSGIVMAEIGSLSLEFTRLAQITGEPKYYDAIARIMQGFYEWQDKTAMPGLWPLYVDASGCDRSAGQSMRYPNTKSGPVAMAGDDGIFAGGKETSGHKLSNEDVKLKDTSSFGSDEDDATAAADDDEDDEAKYREKDTSSFGTVGKQEGSSALRKDKSKRPKLDTSLSKRYDIQDDCPETQGLTASPGHVSQTFSLGGMADSTYEYLAKEYLLLGGLQDEYKTMYGKVVDTMKQYLLYRPMNEDERNVLAVGSLNTNGDLEEDGKTISGDLDTELGHLHCFIGGMVGMGAKIFEREDELDTASKLADGCVWLYESTESGIMPESSQIFPCENIDSCPWNKTAYYLALDPFYQSRVSSQKTSSSGAGFTGADISPPAPIAPIPHMQVAQPPSADNVRRQLANAGKDVATPVPALNTHSSLYDDAETDANTDDPRLTFGASDDDKAEADVAKDDTQQTEEQSHEMYVVNRILEERLPSGVLRLADRRYILRPEAIESVFYMYRITGSAYWRDKGWKMFTAIEKATKTPHGSSGIRDVTASAPVHDDKMESFWLAETLKYFYLLFSEETLVSLDDWVLNTEAHPFARPDARAGSDREASAGY